MIEKMIILRIKRRIFFFSEFLKMLRLLQRKIMRITERIWRARLPIPTML